jgi:hypothetical protein
MPGKLSFTIELYQTGLDTFADVQERAKDLSIVFSGIIRHWAADNVDKFEAGAGNAASGATIDPSVQWQALTSGYIKSKIKRDSPGADDLMKQTGDLETALTNVGDFEKDVTADEAIFGTPTDPLNAKKVDWNWPDDKNARRQTIFLSIDDQRMIDHEVQAYLQFGQDYDGILFAKGVAATKRIKASGEIDFGQAA